MFEKEQIVDVTEAVKSEVISSDTIMAERKGVNALILKKTNSTKRFDGKRGNYRLEHHWFASPASDIHSSKGSETTIWTTKEIKPVLTGKKKLFEFFRLF